MSAWLKKGDDEEPDDDGSRWTRDRDDKLLKELHQAVGELDSLTDRLKRVMQEHGYPPDGESEDAK